MRYWMSFLNKGSGTRGGNKSGRGQIYKRFIPFRSRSGLNCRTRFMVWIRNEGDCFFSEVTLRFWRVILPFWVWGLWIQGFGFRYACVPEAVPEFRRGGSFRLSTAPVWNWQSPHSCKNTSSKCPREEDLASEYAKKLGRGEEMIIAVYLDLFAYILPAKYSTLLLSKLILLPIYHIIHLLIQKFIQLIIKDRKKIV